MEALRNLYNQFTFKSIYRCHITLNVGNPFKAANEYVRVVSIRKHQIISAIDSIDNLNFWIICFVVLLGCTKNPNQKWAIFTGSYNKFHWFNKMMHKRQIHHINCKRISINLHNSHYLHYSHYYRSIFCGI